MRGRFWVCRWSPFTYEHLPNDLIARNILLYTLLVDDKEGRRTELIWNIYYHLFLDDASLELLENQSKKLCALAGSTTSWHDNEYGRLIRFCDQRTLKIVREIWSTQSISDLSKDQRENYVKRYKSSIERSLELKHQFFGDGLIMSGFRSASPVSMESLKDFPTLHKWYWDHGITDDDPENLAKATQPNPMFASRPTDSSSVHYGTDPIFGFHLATAYLPLTAESPLSPKTPPGYSHVHKVVSTARLEFQAWSGAFRRWTSQNKTLRFFAGDAYTFCHTLQYVGIAKVQTVAHHYTSVYGLDPLLLDSGDYTVGKAPLSFNVIDTSNLIDHFGSINLLVATSPLLKDTPSASLYTESLARREENEKALMDSLLCGDSRTLSMLLGLFCAEYWTNATVVSYVDEGIIGKTLSSQSGQMLSRLTWKRPISAPLNKPQKLLRINFDTDDLAYILYQVYREMFKHEDIQKLYGELNLLTIQKSSVPAYHRGSFASLLNFIKSRVKVRDWNKVIDPLLVLVSNDPGIIMGGNYIQELYVQLEFLGIYTMPRQGLHRVDGRGQSLNGLSAWQEIPSIVCVTLEVPRAKLRVLTSFPSTKLGTPILRCQLLASDSYMGPPWHNMFSILHIAFGKITTSGSRDSDNFKVQVTEDEHGWTGSSSLIATFCAPAETLLLDPKNATVEFGVQTTPASMSTLRGLLGPDMNLYKTTLGDAKHVYLTKSPPSKVGCSVVCLYTNNRAVPMDELAGDGIRITITANTERRFAKVTALTGRVDFLSKELQNDLKSQSPVESVQISPCVIGVVIGPGRQQHQIYFPVPVLSSRSKTRIARKSSYVEIVAPIADPVAQSFSYFMYPLFLEDHTPVVWNMPYLKMESLPILDITKPGRMQWLNHQLGCMMSVRERKLREKAMASKGTIQDDARINFKDTLLSFFLTFSGLQQAEQRVRILRLNHPEKGGVHVIFLGSSLRLDAANSTVVLDAAILPLTLPLVHKIRPFLEEINELPSATLTVDDNELRLWKEVIPAMVERCRTWEHKSTCEYREKSHIPLSVKDGESPICSCGNGQLPAKFIAVPRWNSVSRYATRIAISPSYSVPFIEEIIPPEILSSAAARNQSSSNANISSVLVPSSSTLLDGLNECHNCGKGKKEDGKELMKCSRCRIARYCSSECQRGNWKEHKKVCGTGP